MEVESNEDCEDGSMDEYEPADDESEQADVEHEDSRSGSTGHDEEGGVSVLVSE